MKSVTFSITLVIATMAPAAHCNLPPGADATRGALLAHERTNAAVQAVAAINSNRVLERWIEPATRNSMSGPEAGFAHMLARRDEVPARLIVHGEPDPVAVRMAKALDAQRIDAEMLSRREGRPGRR